MDELKVSIERSHLEPRDIEAIHRLLGQLTTREIEKKPLGDRLDAIISNYRGGSRLFTARTLPEKDIVGMATLTIKVIPVEIAGYLDDVVADENAPIEGIGSALMQAVTEEADSRQIPLNLTCKPERERAVGLYQKFGFEIGQTNAMRRLPQKKAKIEQPAD